MIGFRRAIAFAAAREYVLAGISVVSTVILARLLRPEEIGVYAVAAGLMAIVGVFRDLGVSSYIVRENELNAARLGTCYGIALMSSWLLAAIIAAIAPAVAGFYAEPGLRDVMFVLALNLLMIPLNSTRLALLRRERRFDTLFYVDLASSLACNVVTIGLAVAGASYMALAWGTLAAVATTVIATQLVWRDQPRIRVAWTAWREVVAFGGYATGVGIVTNLMANLPEMLVGKLLGLHYAGVLSRAQGLLRSRRLLVIGALDAVIFAVASQKHRDGGALASDYLRAMRYTSAVAWPFFCFLGLMAYPVVRVLFGKHWDDSAALLEIIAINGLGMPFYAFNGSFLTAIGAIRTHFVVQLSLAPFKIGVWGLTFWFDLRVAAIAFVIVHAVHVAVSFSTVCRRLGVRRRAALTHVLPSIPLAVAASIVPIALHAAGTRAAWGDFGVLVVGAIGSGLLWLATVFATGHPLKDEVIRTGDRILGAVRAPRPQA